jgi:hypothetical protein
MLDMKFREEHLAQDIAKFRLYAAHSSFARVLNGNEWLYLQLRTKMQAAWPNCLIRASTEFQFQLDATLSFHAYTECAIQISTRLCCLSASHLLSNSASADKTAPAVLKNNMSKLQGQKRKALPSGNGGFKRSHPAPRLAPMSKEEEDNFLKDNNRCTKCAWILSENGTHQCNPAQRAMRLKGMRMDPCGPGAKPEPKNASTSA